MTMLTYQGSDRTSSQRSPFAAFVHQGLLPFLHMRETWRRRQSEKMLESLPAEIRKDIGWPTSHANSK